VLNSQNVQLLQIINDAGHGIRWRRNRGDRRRTPAKACSEKHHPVTVAPSAGSDTAQHAKVMSRLYNVHLIRLIRCINKKKTRLLNIKNFLIALAGKVKIS
jgi:hypothetical protein